MKKHLQLLLLITSIFVIQTQEVYAISTQNFNFDGQLLDDATGNPLGSNANLVFEIVATNTASNICILYHETQANVPLEADGSFSVKVGPGSGGTRNTTIDGNLPWTQIFQNSGQVRATDPSYCDGGYVPTEPTKTRRLRVTVNGTVLSPDYALSSVPTATVAETLQGKTPIDFLSNSVAGPNDMLGDLQIRDEKSLRLFSNNLNFVALKAPPSLPANTMFVLPNNNGSAGQILSTNGSGVLSWVPAPTNVLDPDSPQEFGLGPANAGPGNDLTLNAGAPAAGQTNAAGGKLILASGETTGTGSSAIEFRTTPGGTPGTMVNNPTTKMILTPEGFLGIGTLAPQRPLHVNGPIRIQPLSLPGGTMGDIAFDSAKRALNFHDGEDWNKVIGSTTIIKPSNQDLISSTTLTADTHFFFNGRPNAKYLVDMVLRVNFVTANGIKLQFMGPLTGSTGLSAHNTFTNSAAWMLAGLDYPINTTSGVQAIHIKGIIAMDNVGGLVTLNWAQQTSNATALQMLSGSFMTVQKLP